MNYMSGKNREVYEDSLFYKSLYTEIVLHWYHYQISESFFQKFPEEYGKLIFNV